ncbi:lipopolysaccharide/colanic/teichoic acid biosynthesis glycosyltransferase [Ancylomarina subtilis]|uniref:Lipopolysaccharide/colanic/teichoic acid biosynthesis glycosyltransferase n=1 Tax=Ancylomarina subtilis TaxID=1639035 RepID=A0A4Q7VKN5_9BACT|nr:sugar transferase [Ancylomarina subtilis]RZT96783.1 lipopolysaccharide/colanic/teichoic acid biosynthesis glycosyltransferase [Ancylomarina subtilis]
MYVSFIKPVLDFILALFLLILFSPLLLFVYIMLALRGDGNPIFYQERSGLHEKPFRIIKFKTMTDEKDADGNLLPDADRLTPLGRIIRKTSIDELPQLINVLKGDISVIGPRPLVMRYLPRYNKEQARRHDLKPGITGWAQVNGRDAISWDEKFRLDIYYVDHVSFGLDLKILFKTIIHVLLGKDESPANSDIMEEWYGN